MSNEASAAPVLRRLEMRDLNDELARYLAPRVERLGYLGEFFKCMGHQPQALLSFMQFTEAAKGPLPDRLVEIVALTVAGRMKNAYERNQHERLSLRLGFGRQWVAQANTLDPTAATELSAQEQRLQRFVLEVLGSDGHEAHGQFGQLVVELGPEQATAVLMVIGRYVTHALIVNTLQLSPPVPSVFEDGFTP